MHGSTIPLTEQILNVLREDILCNNYKIGDKLNESILSKSFSVSRTPVREALKQLCVEGLVESVPNIGVFVTGVSSQDAKDIAEIMVAIELEAIERAVTNCNENDLNELRDIFDLMKFYYEKEDVSKVLELDTRFHWKIFELSQSRLIEKLLREFHVLMKSYRKFSLNIGNRIDTVMTEHENILIALEKKDLETLKEQVGTHRESFRNILTL